MAWTYSDYVTYDPGNATRLTRLRLFKKELLDALQNGKYKLGDHDHDPAVIEKALERVDADLADEEAITAEASGSVAFMTRGRAKR